ELHEHEVPNLHITAAIARKRAVRMAKFDRSRTEVVMNLRAWSARSRIAHLPKIVFLIQTQDPIASDAGTGNPELCRVVIFAENRDPQLVDRQFEFSCQKC